MPQAVSRQHEPWQLRSKGAHYSRLRGHTVVPGNRALRSRADPSAIAERMSDCLRSVAASGDRAAFEQLFRHFAPRIKAYLQKKGGDSAAAEELMQETMVTIWRKASQFDPSRASAATWVFTIARNLRIDAYRHERHPEIDLNDPALVPGAEPGADELIQMRQAADRVGAALANLSEGEQTILRLAFFEDETHQSISERLQLPLGTVKSRMRLAFGKLRKAFVDSTGESR